MATQKNDMKIGYIVSPIAQVFRGKKLTSNVLLKNLLKNIKDVIR